MVGKTGTLATGGGVPRDSLVCTVFKFCAVRGNHWDGGAESVINVMRGPSVDWSEYGPPSAFCMVVGTGKLPDTANGGVPPDSLVRVISTICSALGGHWDEDVVSVMRSSLVDWRKYDPTNAFRTMVGTGNSGKLSDTTGEDVPRNSLVELMFCATGDHWVGDAVSVMSDKFRQVKSTQNAQLTPALERHRKHSYHHSSHIGV